MNKAALLFVSALVSAPVALGLQLKHAIDNEKVVANIAVNDITRIAVVGDRIKSVRGIQGAYTRSQDPERGEIFIQPNPAYPHKAFTILLTTEKGRHYTLLLTALNVPSDTLMLVPQGVSPKEAASFERSTPYEQTLFRLIKYMIHDQAPDGYAIEQVSDEPPIPWKQHGHALLVTRYQGDKLEGQALKVTNTSEQPIALNEADFYQAGVRAVALERLRLGPKQSCWLWRVVSHG